MILRRTTTTTAIFSARTLPVRPLSKPIRLQPIISYRRNSAMGCWARLRAARSRRNGRSRIPGDCVRRIRFWKCISRNRQILLISALRRRSLDQARNINYRCNPDSTCPKGVSLDLMYRYVSALPAQGVKAYSTADVSLGWKMSDHFRSIGGRTESVSASSSGIRGRSGTAGWNQAERLRADHMAEVTRSL